LVGNFQEKAINNKPSRYPWKSGAPAALAGGS
jgi:hypothetical protein